MKGFGIEIKNNLLEPKHRKAMSESIWLYMWFLDKMTSVSEQGIGKVLGGKPIKHEEVNQDLEVPRRTYFRWMERLENGGYINIKRTPYGLIVSVNKAFKRFGRVANSGTSRVATNDPSVGENGTSKRSDQSGTSNKTITAKDNNSKTISKDIQAKPLVYGNENINTVVSFLKEKLGGTPDGTIAENRRFAKLLLDRMNKDYPDKPPPDLVCSLIERGLKDAFHGKNITSFRYLYYNTQKIIQAIKGDNKKNNVLKL